MSKWDTLHRIDGLHVGMLDEDELAVFNEACRRQQARRNYQGVGGLMGLAKVQVLALSLPETTRYSQPA